MSVKIPPASVMVFILLMLQSTLAFANDRKVIYGDDDRIDIDLVKDLRILELSKSTAAMLPKDLLSPSSVVSDRTSVKTRVFGVANSLCSAERFYDYPKAALCSGFLVGKNLLVTAGHCVTNVADCGEYSWIFDYDLKTLKETKDISVPSENVYSCKKIVKQVLERGARFGEGEMDYALIELDRSVEGRKPLEIRTSGQVAVGEKLIVIGHPSGLPSIVGSGFVRSTSASEYFQSNLDTYGGNSGSAVFNDKTGVVEGILVRGEDDFEMNLENRCMESKRCTMGECRGEDVTRISALSALIQELNGQGPEPEPSPSPSPVQSPVPSPSPSPAPSPVPSPTPPPAPGNLDQRAIQHLSQILTRKAPIVGSIGGDAQRGYQKGNDRVMGLRKKKQCRLTLLEGNRVIDQYRGACANGSSRMLKIVKRYLVKTGG